MDEHEHEHEAFYEKALAAYCEREAERAERYRKWRYGAEVVLVKAASAATEDLLDLHIPMNDWTVRLLGSRAYPVKMANSAWGCAQALIDPARNLWLWYYPAKDRIEYGTVQ